MSPTRPRRVALVIGQLTRGGAEGQLVQVARRLDRQRFEPLVFCLSGKSEPYGAALREVGVPLHIIEGTALRRLFSLASCFASERIDIIHSWLFLANAAAGLAQLRRPSAVLVTSARNRKVQGRLNQLANVVAFRRSRAIVVNSADVGTYIERHYAAPKDRIRVVFNGIDTERFHPAEPNEQSIGPIVTIGRMVEQKNHALFLDAAAELVREFPGLRFVIIGDGPLRTQLAAQAQQLGIASCTELMGEIDNVETVLRGASLFWLTSRWEGMPNVVLEAMASGVPAIATNVGGARDLICDSVDGFILASGDCAGFVERSRQLLRDAGMRKRFAAAARQHAESFSTQRMVEAMQQLYDEVSA
ncbi:MAG: glycosyltransferase [Deltaproteobacteria bacterium]|nr:glycosyltransferase [Deltaproteobacteria bacterium]